MKTTLSLSLAVVVLAFAGSASAREKTKKTTSTVVTDDGTRVSTTRTTSATTDPEYPYYRRDVVESRADYRRRIEGKHWTLAPMVGYGSNGLGVGVGGRLGYTFATPIYIGGNFVYHAGADTTPRIHAYYPSAEFGYDFGVDTVLLRPYGGVGVLFRGGDVPTTNTGLVYPGFTFHWLIPRSPAFLGADARVLLPFDGGAALAVMGTVGANL
jgi:hypothetical protein